MCAKGVRRPTGGGKAPSAETAGAVAPHAAAEQLLTDARLGIAQARAARALYEAMLAGIKGALGVLDLVGRIFETLKRAQCLRCIWAAAGCARNADQGNRPYGRCLFGVMQHDDDGRVLRACAALVAAKVACHKQKAACRESAGGPVHRVTLSQVAEAGGVK